MASHLLPDDSRPSRSWTLRTAFALTFAIAIGTAGVLAITSSSAKGAKDDRRPDFRYSAQALVGGTVVTAPGRTIESGTVIIRDGIIEAVGPMGSTTVPFDAELIDAKGLYVYAGFIDLYGHHGVPRDAAKSKTGAARPIPYGEFADARTPPDDRVGITPEFSVADVLDWGDAISKARRADGFTSALAAPFGAIAAGQSVLVSANGQPRRESILAAPVALHIALANPNGSGFDESREDCAGVAEPDPPAPSTTPTPPPATPAPNVAAPSPSTPGTPNVANPTEGRRRTAEARYPVSLMGVVAHLRQAMLDAEHHQQLQRHYRARGGARPPFDPALDALAMARGKTLPVWWQANTRDEIHRVLDLAEEFGASCTIVGAREADRALDRLKSEKTALVIKLDFADAPKVPPLADYAKKPATDRTEPHRSLEERSREARERLELPRKLAKSGVRFGFSSDGLPKNASVASQVRKLIQAGLPREAALDALTRRAAEIVGQGNRLGTIEPGKLGHLVVLSAPFGDEDSRVRMTIIDGQKFEIDAEDASNRAGRAASKKASEVPVKKSADDQETPPQVDPAAKTKNAPEPGSPKAESPKDQTTDKPTPPETIAQTAEEKTDPKSEPPPKTKPESAKPAAAAEPALNIAETATEFDDDRKPGLKTGGDVLIKDAIILTVTKGTIPRGSILVRGGKIAAVDSEITAPEGVATIDAAGMVAMPGIIDTHSHMAIQGGVNENSLSIVSEVRVKDVVTGDDPGLYRALAGGTTAGRLLHGSANTIGGQDAVIKFRYGQAARDLILKDGPQGVKFALGENVTRTRTRFPNTRMGVEAVIVRAFEEAKSYKERWTAYGAALAAGGDSVPPRRDLRLESLVGILDGSIKIHSHCYRSDEILMLLRICERYGVRVQSLQHVLEGYKVAPEIAAHGASNSTFSDWWAYKIEAFDAIPFNAALLANAGAAVCIKSDSEELVRHLNLETAKMVRYGGVSETQALAMVTINAAKQLGLDHRLGSIEVGKDADIALFNAHPLDAFARCEMALIDGEVWFQRDKSAGAKLTPRPGSHAKMPLDLLDAPHQRIGEIATDPKARTFVIKGATLHPVTGPDIANGALIVQDGKIAAIGGPDLTTPAGAVSVDGSGFDVWPGMIDAGTVVGLFEVGSLRETQDYMDSAPFQPELRTSVAINPDSELIPVTRAAGVLSAFIQPDGGAISGQGCVASLHGWVAPEMAVRDAAALVVNVPPSPRAPRRASAATEGRREEQQAERKRRLKAIADQFRLALRYDKICEECRSRKASSPTPDPRLEALVPYAKGEKPVILRAQTALEILDALALAKELKLKAVLSGGQQAWRVTEAIKAAGVPVIVEGTLRLPQDDDPYDAPYALPAKLHEAGIPFAIKSQGNGAEQGTAGRNLPFEAATAVAFGLPEDEALKAVTIAPARILGVDDELGSLDPGKRANLVITKGHLLQPTSRVEALFINGKPLTPESRHTRLYDKYRKRLAEYQAGVAPLGLDRGPKSQNSAKPAAAVAPASSPVQGTETGPTSSSGDR